MRGLGGKVVALWTLVGAACGGNGGEAGGRGGSAGEATHGSAAAGGAGGAGGVGVEIDALADGSFACRPRAAGPFPCVLYNHGGKGTQIGGDLEGTCRALAEAGTVARSEKRPRTTALEGHLEDVLGGLAALRADPACDATRVGIMGFSRGGLLTLQAALAEGSAVDAAVLLAPASGNGALEKTLADVSSLAAPVWVRVAENDLYQDDHVALAKKVSDALEAAGKTVDSVVYPPFGNDGHELFFEVREPYWSDVRAALQGALSGG